MGKKIDGRTGKNGSEPSKNRPKSDPKRGKTRKSGLHRTKNGSKLSKNRPKSDPKQGKTRKKWASQGKKRVRALKKSPENRLKTGKSGKNGDFGAKNEGWGSGEKWALLPILQYYEVAKWVQMNFSRIFFR